MKLCTCAKDKQITCIVHPTELALKERIAELEAENAVLKNALREIESVSVYGQDLNEAIAIAGRALRPPKQESE